MLIHTVLQHPPGLVHVVDHPVLPPLVHEVLPHDVLFLDENHHIPGLGLVADQNILLLDVVVAPHHHLIVHLLCAGLVGLVQKY